MCIFSSQTDNVLYGIMFGELNLAVAVDEDLRIFAVSDLYKDQLSLANQRDALHHGERAANKPFWALSVTLVCGRLKTELC